MKFVDEIRVHAKAGDGGNGCCSFRREKFIPRGGPDGGDGGKGGDIILVADHDVDSLVALFFEPLIRSKRGAHGKGKDKHGRSAEDTFIKVPIGTVIYRAGQSQRDEVEEEPIADLSEPGQEFILSKGGDGGKGNTHFKSSTNRVPRQVTKGYPAKRGGFYSSCGRLPTSAWWGIRMLENPPSSANSPQPSPRRRPILSPRCIRWWESSTFLNTGGLRWPTSRV